MSNEDPKAGSLKPALRPLNPIDGMEAKVFGYNKPLFEIMYEHHGVGIIGRKDLEVDNICKYKQGFVSLVTKITPFNSVSYSFCLLSWIS